MIHYIDDNVDLAGKRVLVRADLNAPVEDGKVTDTFRLDKIVETVDFLRAKKAKIILFSHITAGKGSTTLVPMWEYLTGFFPASFCPTYFTPEASKLVADIEDGGVLIFENIRMNPGENENSTEFAARLAQYGDIYVNDAFSESHRAQASVTLLPTLLPKYGGLLLRKEIEHLSKAFVPERPFIFILGGAKFETKLPIIKKYLDKADKVFVGGAIAHNFFREKGWEIGTSLVSEGEFGIREMLDNQKLVLPVDVTVQNTDAEGTIQIVFKKSTEVLPTDCIADVGRETVEALKDLCAGARTIVWNGPMGNYEKGFTDKTERVAEIVAESGATTVVGGGDTLAAIKNLGLEDTFTFISTGGGAMLDYLVNETLPGIDALQK